MILYRQVQWGPLVRIRSDFINKIHCTVRFCWGTFWWQVTGQTRTSPTRTHTYMHTHTFFIFFLQGQLENCWLTSLHIQRGVLLCCCSWHLSQWKPTVCMLTEYLPFKESAPPQVQKDYFIPSPGFGWQAKNQRHSFLMGGCFKSSSSYTFVSSFLRLVPCPSQDEITYSILWLYLTWNWFY